MLYPNIITKLYREEEVDDGQILALFQITEGEHLAQLMEAAYQKTRDNRRTIKFTSTVHITNQCQVTPKCKYCGFAAGTSHAGYFYPFFKSDHEILQAARRIEDAGIPRVSCSGAHGYGGTHAVNAARIVKEQTNLELLINVGADLTRQALDRIAAYGTDTICCNLETVNETVFSDIKPGEKLEDRKKICRMISDAGLELSSGLLIGVGESYQDRINHLTYLRQFPSLGEIPIMGFNPYPDTPMQSHPPCSLTDQMKTIAITRLLFPDIRITVPTPTIGPENVKYSLLAGADNLATVIPDHYPSAIKGVGSPSYGSLREVLSTLEEMGLVSEMRVPHSRIATTPPLTPGV